MPGILFNNVWMLAGLAALSVPLIIHLLLRRKKKRVRFSTVQFFLKKDEQSSQRRKLRNWLLLSLRLLICALLVFAFARPYMESGALGVGRRPRQVVVILDRSLSMRANVADGSMWLRAREAARDLLSDLKTDDRAALVSCAGRTEVLSEWAPASAVSQRLNELEPTYGAGNLGEGMQHAARLLSVGNPDAEKMICVVSDLQQSGCQNLAAYPVPMGATVKVVKVSDLVTPNLAMTELQLEPKGGIRPYAVLASFSDEDHPDVKLDVTVDGQSVGVRSVGLSAGGSTNIELALPPFKPGWHDIAVRLQARDALRADDARFETSFTPKPAQVLLVEPHPSSRSFEEETFFIAAALEPSKDSTNGPQSGFACEKISSDELERRLNMPSNSVRADLVVLPGLKQLPTGIGAALLAFVRNGGGLLLFLGDGLSANRYNTELRELLPARLAEVQSSPMTSLGWQIGAYQTNTPSFGAFQLPNSGKLSLARFTKRFGLSEANGGAVIARFNDGVPLVIAQPLGRGRVVLVNATADTGWHDWPKHKTFVPWMHGTCYYLANQATRDQIQSEVTWTTGAFGDIDLGAAMTNAQLKLRGPDGKDIAVAADERGQLRDMEATAPGIYSLRDAAGVEIRRLSANVPPAESILNNFSTNDFQQAVARAPEENKTTLAAGIFGAGGNQKELWRVLLLAVLGLLFLELLIANRTLA